MPHAPLSVSYTHLDVYKRQAVARSHWAHSEGNAANSGPELFEPLYENINSKIKEGSITAEFKTALSKFITDENGAVLGAVATTDSGSINIKATKGIMLATGGYCASDEMKMKFCQEALPYTCLLYTSIARKRGLDNCNRTRSAR